MSEQLIEVKTIGEVEHIVHASGMWDGTESVEFSNDGATWSETWAPTEEHPHPQFARVTVHRKDVKIPTRKTIRWDEQYPEASDEWAAKWMRSPMRHFGRTVRMVAMRETFRDLLGNVVIEDESDDRAPWSSAPSAPPTPTVPDAPRDWAAEFAAAATLDALDALGMAARRERAFTPNAEGTALHRAFKRRRGYLVADAAIAESLTTDAEPSETYADAEPQADAWPTEVQTRRPEPRDFQAPRSTATKRRKSGKRGRR